MTKICTVCHIEKDLSEYSTSGKRGLHSECKTCAREAQRVYRLNHLERELLRSRQINRTRINPRIPEHETSRRILRHAVQAGKVKKPDICMGCGLTFERRLIHGHHRDYSKPFEVLWLCPRCHGLEHRVNALGKEGILPYKS